MKTGIGKGTFKNENSVYEGRWFQDKREGFGV